MAYQLGIDLGTTYTAAAVCRSNDRAQSDPESVTLGTRSATVASVLYLAEDGSVLVGEAAERRALTDPDRVVREFKRRIGDETPLIVGGRPYQAHDLAAKLVRWVVDRVAEREGGPASRVALTHPASWGPHKKQLLEGALTRIGLRVTFLAEPQAAAVHYASAERVESGSTVAVYDLGGGTFDAAVVRKNGSWTLLGQPEGIERLGGVDFDEAVFTHVKEGLGRALDKLDPADESVVAAVARLRRECTEAKEALSADTEVTIPVLLPELRTQARLTRGEFESMIRPALEDTVEALRRAVSSAGLAPPDLTAVLLVGGSSRIPLVAQLVSAELGRPVAVDADPKNAIAFGAALAVSPQRSATAGPPGTPPPGGPATPQQPFTAPQAGRGPLAGAGPAAAAAGVAAAAWAAGGGPGTPAGGVPTPTSGQAPGGPGGPPPPRPPMNIGGPQSQPVPTQPGPIAYQPPAGPPQQPARPVASYDRPQAEPEPKRPIGLLIGVGGVLAVAAIVVSVLLFANQTPAATSNTSTTTPTTEQTEEVTSEEPAPVPAPAPQTRRPPTQSTVARPPTTTTNPPTTTTTQTSQQQPNPQNPNQPQGGGAGDGGGASGGAPSGGTTSAANDVTTSGSTGASPAVV
jgi:actin-like ATPase involved in cell morphogenesis